MALQEARRDFAARVADFEVQNVALRSSVRMAEAQAEDGTRLRWCLVRNEPKRVISRISPPGFHHPDFTTPPVSYPSSRFSAAAELASSRAEALSASSRVVSEQTARRAAEAELAEAKAAAATALGESMRLRGHVGELRAESQVRSAVFCALACVFVCLCASVWGWG